MTPDKDDSTRPLLRVVSGSATEEELAAVIAVVAASGGTAVPPKPTFSLWARKSRSTRPMLRPGFGAWRGSMMPR